MTSEQIKTLLEQQRKYYKSGATIPISFRKEQLKKLYSTVKKYESEVNDALKADLGKSHFEGFMCESASYGRYRLRNRQTLYAPHRLSGNP